MNALWLSLIRPARRYLAILVIVVVVVSAGSAVALTSASHGASFPAPRFLRVNGAKIGYRDFNPRAKGTPLLLIIGYGSTMSEWDPGLLGGLTAGRRLITVENRGAGVSSGSVKGLSIRTMAADAAGVIRDLKLGRADVLGWSMGGFIAQELALDYPGLVRRLILASTDPGSPRTTPGKPAVIRALTNPTASPAALLPILFPPEQTGAADRWLAAIASQPGVSSQDFDVSAATKAAQTIATTTLWLRAGRGTYARLPELRARTLVAFGTDDIIVPPSNAQLLLRRIPHAKVLRFRDAGHAFLFQDPARAARAFTAFLR